MKLYTFYTDTHKVLFDRFFLPSVKENGIDKKYELVVLEGTQHSKTGDFNSQGTLDTWKERLKKFIDIIEENWGDGFIYSDCDVQFFKNFHDDLMGYDDAGKDMLCQSDMGTICTGFMYLKCNKITLKFFNKIQQNLDKFANDQLCVNYYSGFLRYLLLPEKKYMTIAALNGGKVWTPDQTDIEIPKDIVLHHGNYTIGIEHKIRLMEMVKEKLSK